MEPEEALTKLFASAFRDTLKHCSPGATFREIILLASSVEARSAAMAPVIGRNQAYEEFFESMDMLRSRMTTWNEEEGQNPSKRQVILERTAILLQKGGTRNSIAAIQLNRLGRTGLKRKKTDRFMLNINEQLRYALNAEEDCQNRGLPGSEQGFIAGYHFDLLTAIFNAQKAPADAKTAIKLAWDEGTKSARIAASIVGSIRTFDYPRHAYAAALVAPLGKALMATLYPIELAEGSWVKFAAACEKYGDQNWLALWTGQRRRYPLQDAELASLLIGFIGLFPDIGPALAFNHDPQFLRESNPKLYLLSALISVSNALALQRPGPGRAGRLGSIHLRCLKDLGLEISKLDELVQRALAEEQG